MPVSSSVVSQCAMGHPAAGREDGLAGTCIRVHCELVCESSLIMALLIPVLPGCGLTGYWHSLQQGSDLQLRPHQGVADEKGAQQVRHAVKQHLHTRAS